MNIDSIKELLDGFDPAALLPDLEKLFASMEPVIRFAVMAGPVCLLVLGLIYLFAAPKEANHTLGFRCWWGMSSVEVWQYTQRLAGLIWTGLGAVLTVVIYFISAGYAGKDQNEMMRSALSILGWELGLVFASVVAINVVIIVLFDRKGYRRRRTRI